MRTAILAIAIIVTGVVCTLGISGSPSDLLPTPPEVHAKHHTLSLTLHAGVASDGKNSFYFDGRPNAPTLRVSPGDQLKITYINDLPAKAKETCAITPCMDMTNLHFHGLEVSPDAPQDDVLDMMAAPGQTLHLACFGITRTHMERATGKRLTACPEQL
jgi:FtsP/CotA-like multicopper oxidase with cupredoxin domain